MKIPTTPTPISVLVNYIRRHSGNAGRLDIALSLLHRTDPKTLSIQSKARLHGVLGQDYKDASDVGPMIDMMIMMIDSASFEAEKSNWLWGTIRIKILTDNDLHTEVHQFWVNQKMDIKTVLDWNEI